MCYCATGDCCSTTIVTATAYLAGTDALAINAGTWTIDPAQSTGIMLGGVLPIEEFVFFLLITVLVTWGLTLGIAVESWARIESLLQRLRGKPTPPTTIPCTTPENHSQKSGGARSSGAPTFLRTVAALSAHHR